MEKRLLNDGDIGKTFKFTVAFEKDEISKSSKKPMLVIGLSLETMGDIPIEKLVYIYLPSSCQWRINDFLTKINKSHLHIEFYDHMWNGWEKGTLKGSEGFCTINKDDYGFKIDDILTAPPVDKSEPIDFNNKASQIDDDDIPF